MRKRTVTDREIAAFRRAVWTYYHAFGRHDLPWRKTTHPYRIMISEIMLQQTQVPRVIEKYRSFLKAFPSVRALARAPLKDVLRAWSGLGYNRRAKYLHDAARMIVHEYRGDMNAATAAALPGIGPYTRAAIRVFAYNEPRTMLETNIRAVYIHHFFPAGKRVHDRDLVELIERCARDEDPRTWHWALMDYGTHVKRLHKNPTRRSASYVMQTKFEGSLREIRGAVIKLLNTGAHGDLAISKKLQFDEKRVRDALNGLARDGLVLSEKGSWRIA